MAFEVATFLAHVKKSLAVTTLQYRNNQKNSNNEFELHLQKVAAVFSS